MIGSREYEYVFIANQRSGSRSMRRWLLTYYGGETIAKYHGTTVPEAYKKYFRFMGVRNPYERTYSLWCHWLYYTNTVKKGAKIRAARKAARQGFVGIALHYYKHKLSQSDMFNRSGAKYFTRLETLNDDIKQLPFYDSAKPEIGRAHV